MSHRHTMGQDWGGRRPLNPRGCRKVSSSEVRQLATEMGTDVKRDGYGMWFFRREETWFTLGQTNYLALNYLKQIAKESTK